MRSIFTLPFVFVLLVYKAIHLLHVLKQDVATIGNVTLMKSVTLPLVVDLLVRSVKLFVIQAIVLEVLIAMQKTIGKPVSADFH